MSVVVEKLNTQNSKNLNFYLAQGLMIRSLNLYSQLNSSKSKTNLIRKYSSCINLIEISHLDYLSEKKILIIL